MILHRRKHAESLPDRHVEASASLPIPRALQETYLLFGNA